MGSWEDACDEADLWDVDWSDRIAQVESPAVWLTGDFSEVPIRKMKTGHVVNTLNLLGRREDMVEAAGAARCLRLRKEAEKRGCLQVSPTHWRTPPADDFTVLTEKPR